MSSRHEREAHLATTLDNIEYFTREWLVSSTLAVQNIRLMDLDTLLMDAKFALDAAIQAQPYWMLHISDDKPASPPKPRLQPEDIL